MTEEKWAPGDPPRPPNAQECIKRLRALARWYRAGTSTLMTGSDMVVFDCAADELERGELNLKAADAALAETQARYEKDLRALYARSGKIIDARNTFVAGACTAEQLCDKIDMVDTFLEATCATQASEKREERLRALFHKHDNYDCRCNGAKRLCADGLAILDGGKP